MPLLKTYYGTGGDLNVDELHDVILITERYGLRHPQEGVVNGHIGSAEGPKAKAIEQLRIGVSQVVNDAAYVPVAGKYAVADMITGWGVAKSVRRLHDLRRCREGEARDRARLGQCGCCGWLLPQSRGRTSSASSTVMGAH